MKSGNESVFLAKSFSQFINSYAPDHLTASESTLKSYTSTINKYLRFLEDQKGYSVKTLCRNCFERTVIEEWLRYMRNDEHLSTETCNVRLGGLRTFLKYLGQKDIEYKYLYLDAMDIPLKKTLKKKVNGLSKDAVKAIMAEPDQSAKTGRRDLVFMMVAYGTAARMSEILSVKLKHIHLDCAKPYITVIGKGNKTRTLYILPKLVTHLRRYIKEVHGESSSEDSYLFYSRNGNHKDQLSSKAIEKRLHIYAEKAHQKCNDVPLNLHAHQFRHARATHWLEEGINIVEISVLLGHEQLATTMKYLDISTEDQMKGLATMDDENTASVSRKWKKADGSLKSLLKR